MATTAGAISSGNRHIVCQYKETVASFGVFLHRNPLNFTVPLVLFQLTLIAVSSHFVDLCLRPLGQSAIVTQILGGVICGPSLLGYNPAILHTIFPNRNSLILETAADFGVMFCFFAIGVGSDSSLMIRPERQPVIIAISAMFVTLISTVVFSIFLKNTVHMDETLSNALPLIAASQCLSGFANVVFFISEQKLSNTELGRLALSASMVCDLLGISIIGVLLSIAQSGGDPVRAALSISSMFTFVMTMAFVVSPLVRHTSRRIKDSKSMAEIHVFCFFGGALCAALATEVIGQHFAIGPMILGLTVPDGQPLGMGLISRLEYPIGKLLYPTFLTLSGIKTNIFSIDTQSLWIVMLLMTFACLTKITSVVCACRFLNIHIQDSVVIGLILNARGVCEIVVYNLWRESGILSDKEFTLCILSIIGVTAVIAPIIKHIYDPTTHNVALKRRTIQHIKRDVELRILICIQNQENMPMFINLLEASHATQISPIVVAAVILIELAGRATQMVVAHQSTRSLQQVHPESGHIINALRQYELCNELCATVQTFTTISHVSSMHQDIFRTALDQNTTIIILPFHKHWEIDGSIGSENRAMQNMNVMVLNQSPCSVGILVDRSILTGSLSILNNQSIFRVAVIFIGGADDAESLCYGARMGRHISVTLTIIRFLFLGCDTSRERKQDNGLIEEVWQANADNHNFIYQEQVVKDGVGLAKALRGLGNEYELIIVGRHHQESEILMGLGAWSECPELGVVGDMLASQDFEGSSSVLVVQQQRLPREKQRHRVMKPAVASNECTPVQDHRSVSSFGSGPSESRENDPSWEISIDRNRT